MTTINEDHIKEVLSIIRGAAITPLVGMTKTEIEQYSRLSVMKIELCIEALLSRKCIAPVGTREGESVYKVIEQPTK